LLTYVPCGGASDRLKVNCRVLRSCIRWCTRACRTRYGLRSGCGRLVPSTRNSAQRWATKSLSKPAQTITWWLLNRSRRSAYCTDLLQPSIHITYSQHSRGTAVSNWADG